MNTNTLVLVLGCVLMGGCVETRKIGDLDMVGSLPAGQPEGNLKFANDDAVWGPFDVCWFRGQIPTPTPTGYDTHTALAGPPVFRQLGISGGLLPGHITPWLHVESGQNTPDYDDDLGFFLVSPEVTECSTAVPLRHVTDSGQEGHAVFGGQGAPVGPFAETGPYARQLVIAWRGGTVLINADPDRVVLGTGPAYGLH